MDTWLFPIDGSTRHFSSLQVSFGSNDEFFAFDQFGKVSSRETDDALENSSPVATQDVIVPRRKSHTFSNQSIPEELLIRVNQKSEVPKYERRRNIITGGVPVRRSWPEKMALIAKEDARILEAEDRASTKSNYVHAAVQTEPVGIALGIYVEEDFRPPSRTQSMPSFAPDSSFVGFYQHSSHTVSIGSMQDLCRKQHYRLGDALHHV